MKVKLTFTVDDETRRAIANEIDGKEYNGKRKATRPEIEGKICDGAEDSLCSVTAMYSDESRVRP